MGGFYDDPRFGTLQTKNLQAKANQTSVIAARVEADRRTMMQAVTIKDWNVHFIQGDTTTGTSANHNGWKITLGKSAAGTGAFAAMGTAWCGTAGQANGSVLDASLTETNLDAGDDLILAYEAGTALPAGVLRVEADVQYVELYT